MKKLLALTLALMFMFSCLVISNGVSLDESDPIDDLYFLYDPIDRVIKQAYSYDMYPVYGSEVYFKLNDENGYFIDSDDYDAVRAMKIRENWDDGGNYVEDVEIVRARYEDPANGDFEYGYFLAFSLRDATRTDTIDVAGEIELSRTGDEPIDTYAYVSFTIGYPDAANSSMYYIEEYLQLYDFDEYGGEHDHLFYLADTAGTFEVDTYSQSPILLSVNFEDDDAVADKFPDADLVFMNGNGATFERLGTMGIEVPYNFVDSDEDVYVYEVQEDGMLIEMDSDFEYYQSIVYFETRTLGNFIVADSPIIESIPTPPTSSGSTGDTSTTKPIPSTGAVL